jgi:hypothetical protein
MLKEIIESVKNEGKVSSEVIKQMTDGLSASEKRKAKAFVKKAEKASDFYPDFNDEEKMVVDDLVRSGNLQASEWKDKLNSNPETRWLASYAPEMVAWATLMKQGYIDQDIYKEITK